MSMDSIRKGYNVPAKRGRRIKYCGRPGTIVGSRFSYLRVRMDHDPKRTILLHPQWRVSYES